MCTRSPPRSAPAGWGRCIARAIPGFNRDVAIKVLPELFASDRDRLLRFEREAQVLASLNHPNIAHVHGVIEQRTGASVRLTVTLPADYRVAQPPVISPDARMLAYVAASLEDGVSKLYLRPLDSFESREVSRSTNAAEPFFSPDSRFVGFYAEGELRRAHVSDGSTTSIQRTGGLTGASWGEDGYIIFSTGQGSPLQRVPAEGGAIEPLTELGGPQQHHAHVWPQHLPGGDVLFRVWTGNEGLNCRLTLRDRKWSCFRTKLNLRYVRSGHALTDGSRDTLGAFSFSVEHQPRFDGAGETILTPVFWRPNDERGFFCVSAGRV